MEINNKIIRGVFLYDPQVTYTSGDFVIKDSTIYVVQSDVTGIDPTSSESSNYYKIYLADEIGSDEDFERYALGRSNEDKLVSARSLGRILNKYMSGFNDKGIIESYITDAGEIFLKDYFGNQTSIDITNSYINPLDKLMVSDINNGTFIISNSLTRDILGDTNVTNQIILRQYTYKDLLTEDLYVRVQELFDPVGCSFRFRYSNSAVSFDPINPWKTTFFDEAALNNVNNIITYYQSKVNELETTKINLLNNFRFKKVEVETITPNTSWKIKGDINNSYTICTKELDSKGIYRLHSCTVDLSPLEDIEMDIFVVNDRTYRIVKELDYIKITKQGNNNSLIDNVYYKQTYDDLLKTQNKIGEIWKTAVPFRQEENLLSTARTTLPPIYTYRPADVGMSGDTFNTLNLGVIKVQLVETSEFSVNNLDPVTFDFYIDLSSEFIKLNAINPGTVYRTLGRYVDSTNNMIVPIKLVMSDDLRYLSISMEKQDPFSGTMIKDSLSIFTMTIKFREK